MSEGDFLTLVERSMRWSLQKAFDTLSAGCMCKIGLPTWVPTRHFRSARPLALSPKPRRWSGATLTIKEQRDGGRNPSGGVGGGGEGPDLSQFVAWWKAEVQKGAHPDRHPPTMPDGEWDENYRCWGGGNDPIALGVLSLGALLAATPAAPAILAEAPSTGPRCCLPDHGGGDTDAGRRATIPRSSGRCSGRRSRRQCRTDGARTDGAQLWSGTTSTASCVQIVERSDDGKLFVLTVLMRTPAHVGARSATRSRDAIATAHRIITEQDPDPRHHRS